MKTEDCFSKLIDHVRSAEALPRSLRANVERELGYFRDQSLLELEKRNNHLSLKARWKRLERLVPVSTLFANLNVEKAFWLRIEAFLGAQVSYIKEPKIEALKPIGTSTNGSNLETDQFFKQLAQQACEKTNISELEHFALYSGLQYLHVEAKIGRGQRDKKTIQYIWKKIHPLLCKYRMLEAFENNLTVKQRVRFFLKDGF